MGVPPMSEPTGPAARGDDGPGGPRACVAARIVDGPLTRSRERDALRALGWKCASDASGPDVQGRVGAMVRFEGIVRGAEPRDDGGGSAAAMQDVLALDYETYDPMAENQLRALARDVALRHGLIGVAALHSRGRVEAGQVSFVLLVESEHRAEGLAATTEFIDRMKQDVPIWKRPVWR